MHLWINYDSQRTQPTKPVFCKIRFIFSTKRNETGCIGHKADLKSSVIRCHGKIWESSNKQAPFQDFWVSCCAYFHWVLMTICKVSWHKGQVWPKSTMTNLYTLHWIHWLLACVQEKRNAQHLPYLAWEKAMGHTMSIGTENEKCNIRKQEDRSTGQRAECS